MESFATWLTSPENPRFTTATANRLWKRLFGLGVIEPVDEILETTVPMNPALMKDLRQLMIAKHHDVKAFLRVPCHTQAYQSEVTPAKVPVGEIYHFTGPLLRRMSAEQIWDSFVTLIHPAPDLPNLPLRENTATFLANVRASWERRWRTCPQTSCSSVLIAPARCSGPMPGSLRNCSSRSSRRESVMERPL